MLTPEILAALVRFHCGHATVADHALLAPLALTSLRGGRNNGVYRLTPDRRSLCVKVYKADGRHRGPREWGSLRFLAERGVGFVPRAHHFARVEGLDVIVMDFVPGRHLGGAYLGADQVQVLASHTRQLQTILFEDGRLSPAIRGVGERLAAVRAFCGTAAAGTHAQCACLRAAESWLDGCCPQILQQPASCRFSRQDTSLANALWDGGRLTLVDLEYAGWLPPALDVAEQIEHVQSRGTPDAVWDTFVQQLDLDVLARRQLRPARCLAALEWLIRLWPRPEQPQSSNGAMQVERTSHLLTG